MSLSPWGLLLRLCTVVCTLGKIGPIESDWGNVTFPTTKGPDVHFRGDASFKAFCLG